MQAFAKLCDALSRGVLQLASLCLACLGLVVIYGVTLRYVFNSAPPYVEQIALLLVISVAMFGATAGVHEAGHIGLDSVVKVLPPAARFWCGVAVEALIVAFAAVLFWGSVQMGASTWHDTIPTLGISEAFRYLPAVAAGILIMLFSIQRLMAMLTQRASRPESWN